MRMVRMDEMAGGADEVRASASIGFKIRDASSYDSVAETFDLFTERLSKPLSSRIVSLARLSPHEQVLDVGTGTGIVALEAARRVGSEGKVLGIDLSDGMLATAISKATRAGLVNCEFRKMDAESLEINSLSFDVVLSLFALLHLPDPLKALSEIFRVLRPGGRFVVAVGSAAPLLSRRGIVHRARRATELLLTFRGRQLTAPGFLNDLVAGFPQKDGPEETALGHLNFGTTRDVTALVRRAGFEVVSTDWCGHTAVVATPEEFWEIQRTFSSFARKRLSGVPPERVDLLRKEFLRRCREVQARGGRLVYPFAAFFVVAQRAQS